MSFIRPFQVSLLPPFSEQVSNRDGFVSPSWTTFFGLVTNLLNPLGVEKNFQLKNNLAVAEDIVGLSFSAKTVSQAAIDFYIQRLTNTNEEITSGTFHATYLPGADDWAITMMGTPGPDALGITFSFKQENQFTLTYNYTTGIWTKSGHGLRDGVAIQLVSTGTVPTGYAASTTYYVINSTNNTFKLSATYAGPAVSAATDNGTGTISLSRPTGQVQYTSSNVTGTISISKITWRARTLAAKNSQYSAMGGA